MKPSYYVVIRWNEGTPPTVINIEGPNGEFVDLDGNIDAAVAMLRRNDLRDPEVRRRLEQAQERAEREAERQKDRDREERLEEMRDRINAATRTSVSMNRDQPWAQNANGSGARKGGLLVALDFTALQTEVYARGLSRPQRRRRWG
jgi:hypothetical protein